MKTTTTLLEVITSEAKKEGYDAFFNKETWQLKEMGDSLLTQIAQYTPFIRELTNKAIFGGAYLSDQNADKFFKQVFLNRFINREIKYQTIDLFRNKLVNLMYTNNQWFCETYKYFNDMFNGVGHASTNEGQNQQDENRTANATLPQDQTALSLDDENVPYADETNYGRSKSNIARHQESNTSSNNPSVVQQLDNVYNRKLDEFDAGLFLQIW